jgi:hypothetical protein
MQRDPADHPVHTLWLAFAVLISLTVASMPTRDVGTVRSTPLAVKQPASCTKPGPDQQYPEMIGGNYVPQVAGNPAFGPADKRLRTLFSQFHEAV